MEKVKHKVLLPSIDGKHVKKYLDDEYQYFHNKDVLIKGLLNGSLDLDYPSNQKIVRIFTSSTFTGKNT